MTVYAITDTKKGRTGIVPTYLQTIYIYIYIPSSCLVLAKWSHVFFQINLLPNYNICVCDTADALMFLIFSTTEHILASVTL